VSKYRGGRGTRAPAALVALCLAGPAALGAMAWAGSATPHRGPWTATALAPAGPLGGLAGEQPLGDGAPADGETPVAVDNPTPDQPSDPPTSDPPASPPPVVETTAPAPPPPPAPTVKIALGVGVADLTDGYWNGATNTSFTIYLSNSGTGSASVHVSYTLPAQVFDRGSADCAGGGCDLVLSSGGAALLKVNITVSPQAWRYAPLGGSVSVRARSTQAPALIDDVPATAWGLNFPPGPPVNGLTLTAQDVPLGAAASATGQLVAQLTNTGKVAGAGELQIVTPAGVAVTGFPAGCASHHQAGADTQICELGQVPAGASTRLAFTLSISARARASAPLVGVLRATLAPAGLDPLGTQTSWQITAAPRSPGEVAQDGALPAPTPVALSLAPTPAESDGPIDQITGYAAAAVQEIGWRLMATGIVTLTLVALALAVALRRRRVRLVPLFPAPLPAGHATGLVPVRTGTRTPTDTPATSPAAGGDPLPRRTPAAPPDAFLPPRDWDAPADTPDAPAPDAASPDAAAPDAPTADDAGAVAAEAPAADAVSNATSAPSGTEQTMRIPTQGNPVLPSPYTGTGYERPGQGASDGESEAVGEAAPE
jgi:hypothetical protein